MYPSHAHLPSIGLKKLATEDANSRLLIIVLDLRVEGDTAYFNWSRVKRSNPAEGKFISY